MSHSMNIAYILTHLIALFLVSIFQVNRFLLLKIGIMLRIKDQVLDSGGALRQLVSCSESKDQVLDSGGALHEKDTVFLPLNSDNYSLRIFIYLFMKNYMQNCVIKILGFVIIKKGE